MIEEILKEKIETCGLSRYQIWQQTGIDQAALCRFMQGKTCTLATADKLCELFGLELTEKQKRGKK